MKIEKEKEVYRLWIEFLKRSDFYNNIYKKFYKIIKKSKLESYQLSVTPIKHELKEFSNYRFAISGYKRLFKGIHNKKWSFEKWWKHKIEHSKRIKELYVNKEFVNYTEEVVECIVDFKEYLPMCIDDFKRKNGRKPSLNEFIDFFLEGLKNQEDFLFLRIGADNRNIDYKINYIRDILKKRGKEMWDIQYSKPYPEHIRISELQRYLDVYDMRKKGIKLRDIIKSIEPHKDIDNINVQRAYRMDLQKAKKIIKNTELGLFPGKF